MMHSIWSFLAKLVVGAIPWIGVLLILCSLFLVRFPPSGVFTTSSDFSSDHPWIRTFLPATRVTTAGVQADGWTGQRILEDPVYLNVQTPGPYESADIELEMRPVLQPMVQFGIERSLNEFELVPVYFSELQSPSWTHVQSSAFTGYLSASTSASAIGSIPFSQLAIWNASATMPLLQDPVGVGSETWVSLRGSHDIWVIPTANGADLTIRFQSVNRSKASDSVVVRMFYGDEQVADDVFPLNGSRDQGMGTELVRTFHFPTKKPGVYRFSFRMSDDVFIRSIQTMNSHWVIGPRLYLGDVVGYATTTHVLNWVTDSRHVLAETFHAEGVQTLSLGAKAQDVSKTHVEYRLDRQGMGEPRVSFIAPKGDIRMVGDGFFAVDDAHYFSAQPRHLDDLTELASEGITALYTPYERPLDLGDGWVRSKIHLALNPRTPTMRLILSAPGLIHRAGASVDVRRVKVTFHRPAQSWKDWFVTFRTEASLAWHRLWTASS